MLERIALLAIAAPRRIVAIAALVMVACGIFGIPVAKSLSAGGFQDPTSESAQATQLLVDKFGQGDMELVISVTDDSAADGAQSPAARAVANDIAAQLQASPYVGQLTSAWTAPQSAAPALVSKDGKTGLIVAGITGGESGAQKHAKELTDRLVHDRDGVTVRAGGVAMTYVQINGQSEKDLLMMEAIAIPLSFVVLVWVFGGLMAAALPLVVGMFAILGSMAVLRGITLFTDVSIFALNLSIAMGLALAIDYTLLIISRYRDELAEGADRDRALIRTLATAGRTVLFSALTVALSMVAMVLFPMYFLKSFAYAGIAVVAFAAVAAIVVAPAAIALLGDRLDSLDTRRLFRFLLSRPEPERKPIEQMFWYRSTKFVMRRSIPIGLAIVALLLLLGAPFLSIKWGFPDDRVLPQSLSAREVGDELRNDFSVDSSSNVTVVLPDAAGVPPSELDRYAAALSRVADVSSVSAPGGTFVDGTPAGPPSAAAGMKDGSAFLTVGSTAPLFTDASESQLDAVHAVSHPGRKTRTGHRVCTNQSRQLAGDHRSAASGSRRDRGDHLRAAVPAHRQRGAAAEGVGTQRFIVDRGLRCAGLDLPGWSPGRAGNHAHRNTCGEHAGAVVLHRVRVVDGLRGVPGIPDPRILAQVSARRGRTTTKALRSAWPRRDGS